MKKILLLGVAIASLALGGCNTNATYDVQLAYSEHQVRGLPTHVVVQTTAVQQDFANGATGHFMNVVVKDPRTGKTLSGGTYAFNDVGIPRMVFQTVAPALIGAGGNIAAAHALKSSNFIINGGASTSISGAAANAASGAIAGIH